MRVLVRPRLTLIRLTNRYVYSCRELLFMARREILAASALIASAFAVSAPAQATSFSGTSFYVSIIDGNGAFADSGIPVGMFTDTINFSVPTAGTQDVDLTFLIKSGLSNLAATLNGTPITFKQNGTSFAGNLSTTVASGQQILQITGTSAGKGSYSGNVSFTSAVPELATWLMMIAGIGFTGFAMRRRKPAYSVNYAF